MDYRSLIKNTCRSTNHKSTVTERVQGSLIMSAYKSHGLKATYILFFCPSVPSSIDSWHRGQPPASRRLRDYAECGSKVRRGNSVGWGFTGTRICSHSVWLFIFGQSFLPILLEKCRVESPVQLLFRGRGMSGILNCV